MFWNYFRLAVWGNIWLILWVLSLPFRRQRDNCLTWALKKQEEEGGYIVIRWARTNKVWDWAKHPHFGWLPEDFHVGTQHYVPHELISNENLIPSLWFDGKVKQGDGNELIQTLRHMARKKRDKK